MKLTEKHPPKLTQEQSWSFTNIQIMEVEENHVPVETRFKKSFFFTSHGDTLHRLTGPEMKRIYDLIKISKGYFFSVWYRS